MGLYDGDPKKPVRGPSMCQHSLTGFALGEDLPISVLLSFLFNSFILVACLFLILESREARGLKLGARLSLCL